MYALTNGHTIFRNSSLREDVISSAEFHFEVIRVWYALFKMYNAKQEILHYPSRQPRTRRNVKSVTLSPKKGKNFVHLYYTDLSHRNKVSICNQILVSLVKCGSPLACIYIFLLITDLKISILINTNHSFFTSVKHSLMLCKDWSCSCCAICQKQHDFEL